MIKHLKIKNFVLLKDVEFNLEKGFNVLIGETGAGKSIILKSLMFLLGAKFSKENIRTGENSAKVTGIFVDLSIQTQNVLKSFDIDVDGELILSRSADMSGRNEYRANGEIITHNMLNEIAETLVNFYGQHESINLLKPAKHIEILDSYKPELLNGVKAEIANLLQEYHKIKSDIDNLGGDALNRERTLDLLNYQINEITAVNPLQNEDIDLENKISILRNYEKITTSMQEAINALNSGNGAVILTKNAGKFLANVEQYNADFHHLTERINSCYYELNDVAETLEEKMQTSSYSAYELEKLDARLDELKLLKKKYGNTIDEVLAFLQKAVIEKEKLENADAEIQKLTAQKEKIESALTEKSHILTDIRKKCASELEEKMIKELSLLGMKNSKFVVSFEENPTFSLNGLDNIEFLFSANLGEGLKPLSKTVSGGEMSRFMLALKSIIALKDGVGTLVFDEIDSGISGEIGSAIAEKIAHISKVSQVICITHLPQVSAMADNYIFVAKQSENNATYSFVKTLYDEEIITAISRLSGGNFNTTASLSHATELKNWANSYKKSIF